MQRTVAASEHAQFVTASEHAQFVTASEHARVVTAAGDARSRIAVRLTSAQCAAVVVWVLAMALGSSVWVASALAVPVAAACLLRIGGRGTVEWIATVLRRHPGGVPLSGVLRDFPTGSAAPVGVRWDGPYATVVLELAPPAGTLTRLGRESEESGRTLPLGAIAACLYRHDVVLDGIDVVMQGRRVLDSTPAGQAYAQLLGPLPAAAERTVRVVLRLDVTSCATAVARRGGGSEGAARTVVAGARRVIRALGDDGYTARLLTANEIEQTALRISHGVPATEWAPTPRHVALSSAVDSGGVFEPRRIDRHHTAAVWAHPTSASTLVLRLRPGDHDSVRIGALARFTTRESDVPSAAGLLPAYGRHAELLTAALPLGVPHLEERVPLRESDAEELDALALPAGGCGQLVGSDDAGRAVTARLTGPGVRSVHIAGELYLAQQVVFRAVAVGARVLVHTDRPGAWRGLVGSAAGPDRLRLAGEYAGDRDFDTVVYDGVPPTSSMPHATAIHVHIHPDGWPRERPTVSLLQPGAAGDRVVITAGDERTPLTLVTIAAESTHLGRSRMPDSRYDSPTR
ncbi:type VII secretion protein EccE [Rhodococcus sp. B50]|uniref:type VII secretion protein EccE n=1 Tax=Rhodococcus sp. B50 TaxID=2682847 RepID=UPI001BD1D76A|nr:type VII secretion protein EccE [Rhodococcus sp. B50]MBS9371175.1 ESX-1 secretion system protein EccE1 [Rhodococcus sp. B50]